MKFLLYPLAASALIFWPTVASSEGLPLADGFWASDPKACNQHGDYPNITYLEISKNGKELGNWYSFCTVGSATLKGTMVVASVSCKVEGGGRSRATEKFHLLDRGKIRWDRAPSKLLTLCAASGQSFHASPPPHQSPEVRAPNTTPQPKGVQPEHANSGHLTGPAHAASSCDGAIQVHHSLQKNFHDQKTIVEANPRCARKAIEALKAAFTYAGNIIDNAKKAMQIEACVKRNLEEIIKESASSRDDIAAKLTRCGVRRGTY